LTSSFPQFGDYDGDGKTDFVSRQTINGVIRWWIFQSSTQTHRVIDFGQVGDQRPAEPEGELPVSSKGLGDFR
jgi:hypothetical protein